MSNEIETHLLTKDSWIDEFTIPTELLEEFSKLWDEHPVEYGKVKIMGKIISTPRWQQTYGKSYNFTGMNHDALPVPKIFKPMFDWANSTDHGPFNQMMVNWYLDGSHYIGKHRDAGVVDSNILSISRGETRIFRLRNYKTGEIVSNLPMKDGTVLVLCGKSNSEFTHEVPKVSGNKGSSMNPRINITFRRL
jgi:alkylated DNA repair dioxygenase AlkB